jgi:hypothetical protein
VATDPNDWRDPIPWPETVSDDVEDVIDALCQEALAIYGAVLAGGSDAPIQGAFIAGLLLARTTTPEWQEALLAWLPPLNIEVAGTSARRIRGGQKASRAAFDQYIAAGNDPIAEAEAILRRRGLA